MSMTRMRWPRRSILRIMIGILPGHPARCATARMLPWSWGRWESSMRRRASPATGGRAFARAHRRAPPRCRHLDFARLDDPETSAARSELDRADRRRHGGRSSASAPPRRSQRASPQVDHVLRRQRPRRLPGRGLRGPRYRWRRSRARPCVGQRDDLRHRPRAVVVQARVGPMRSFRADCRVETSPHARESCKPIEGVKVDSMVRDTISDIARGGRRYRIPSGYPVSDIGWVSGIGYRTDIGYRAGIG
jgi:hypothetical protein